MSTPNDPLMNSINTSEVLYFLQYHLQKVAEYQHILEVFTNNILASFIT